jgi:hypothetical protein
MVDVTFVAVIVEAVIWLAAVVPAMSKDATERLAATTCEAVIVSMISRFDSPLILVGRSSPKTLMRLVPFWYCMLRSVL